MPTLQPREPPPIHSIHCDAAGNPPVPDVLACLSTFVPSSIALPTADSAPLVKERFPSIYGLHALKVEQAPYVRPSEPIGCLLRVGFCVVGGPAPGVLSMVNGVLNYMKQWNRQSQLFAYKGGLLGLVQNDSFEITTERMRLIAAGQGLASVGAGRHGPINDILPQIAETVKAQRLNGLIITGGADPTTDAAVITEYFQSQTPPIGCRVVAVIKRAEGPRALGVGMSFGFDSLTKVYAQLVSNLCVDAASAKSSYHFVRLMGEAASQMVLETAMQVHPNFTLVGEECLANNWGVADVVSRICDMISVRALSGKNYGVVVVPEGVVYFIREIHTLICTLREVLASIKAPAETSGGDLHSAAVKMLRARDPAQANLYATFPSWLQQQFLSERDSSGELKLAVVQFDRFLAEMCREELARRKTAGTYVGKFAFNSHFFGYEARSAAPTAFDMTLAYALGQTSAKLIEHGKTGMVATVGNLTAPVSQWTCGAVPITATMEVRNGRVAVRKQVLSLDSYIFQVFRTLRDEWARCDMYRQPAGTVSVDRNITLLLEHLMELHETGPSAIEAPPHLASQGSTVSDLLSPVSNAPNAGSQVMAGTPQLLTPTGAASVMPMMSTISAGQVTAHHGQQTGIIRTDADKQRELVTWYYQACLQDSPFITKRLQWRPDLPQVLRGGYAVHRRETPPFSSPADEEALRARFPHLVKNNFHRIQLAPHEGPGQLQLGRHLHVAIFFSGGPAPGGHNVIAGLHDYLVSHSASSRLLGMLNGPDGVLSGRTMRLDASVINNWRNLGGFNLIGTSRTKIETEEQFRTAADLCRRLNLDGLVVCGGDDSSTNAALLAEAFLRDGVKTRVVAVPKTIDADLRRFPHLEMSFGFDTTAKLYANLVANMAFDAAAVKNTWHFVRLMGRSASHITLEVALQVSPNYASIAEEVAERKMTMRQIAKELAVIVQKRSAEGRNYGIALFPEGLVEFTADMKGLIADLNEYLAGKSVPTTPSGVPDLCAVGTNLKGASAETWQFLPDWLKLQLVGDRDPHGNVRVAQIESERLVAALVEQELRQSAPQVPFTYRTAYFGYQGRCGLVSNFDCSYTYTLGHLAGAMIEHDITGHLATVQNLKSEPDNWQLGTLPLVGLMNTERRKGVAKPVIQKMLVDLKGKPYQTFLRNRDRWALEDVIPLRSDVNRFLQPTSPAINLTLLLETCGDDVPEERTYRTVAPSPMGGF